LCPVHCADTTWISCNFQAALYSKTARSSYQWPCRVNPVLKRSLLGFCWWLRWCWVCLRSAVNRVTCPPEEITLDGSRYAKSYELCLTSRTQPTRRGMTDSTGARWAEVPKAQRPEARTNYPTNLTPNPFAFSTSTPHRNLTLRSPFRLTLSWIEATWSNRMIFTVTQESKEKWTENATLLILRWRQKSRYWWRCERI